MSCSRRARSISRNSRGLDEAIAKEPLFVMGYLIKAKFLERIGRYGEALANVKIGLKYIPNNAEAQAHKAQLERRLERK